MSWIQTISISAATGRLKKLYEQLKGPGDVVDDVMLAHSLRPHALEGHLAIYKSAIHHSGNDLPKWVLEMIGVSVSLLNGCEYCATHHSAGLRKLIGDEKANPILNALHAKDVDRLPVEERYKAALAYAAKLTRTPGDMIEADIDALRAAGFEDGEILEINQVTAYFNYGNRTSLGLGASTKNDILGLSPETTKAS